MSQAILIIQSEIDHLQKLEASLLPSTHRKRLIENLQTVVLSLRVAELENTKIRRISMRIAAEFGFKCANEGLNLEVCLKMFDQMMQASDQLNKRDGSKLKPEIVTPFAPGEDMERMTDRVSDTAASVAENERKFGIT